MAAEIIESAARTTTTSAEIAAELVATLAKPPKSAAEIAAETDTKVDAYLGPLFRYTNGFLPKDRSAIAVHVLTRAETEDTRSRNPEGYNTLCDAIRRYIIEAGFKGGECKVMSRDEEALYGWVAANYSAGTFTKPTPTQGFLDMGGDCAQIAFSPEPVDCKEYKGPLTQIRVGNQGFKVFARTWPSLGINAIRHRHDKNMCLSNEVSIDPWYSEYLGALTRLAIGRCNFDKCREEVLSFIDCKNENCEETNPCVASGNGCLMKDAPLIGSKKFIGASPFWHATNRICDPVDEYDYSLEHFSYDAVQHVRDKMEGNHDNRQRIEFVKNLFDTRSLLNTVHYGLGIQNIERYRYDDIQDVVNSETSGDASEVPFAAIDTNWTLGWVVLFANDNKPEILACRSWAETVDW